jgi:anaerobic ribonucleoside-triphosphate reductase
MMEGDARRSVMKFPIPTINLITNFGWDSGNLKGLWEMTGKYGILYFSNFGNLFKRYSDQIWKILEKSFFDYRVISDE